MYAISSLVLGITVDSVGVGPSFGGAACILNVSLVSFGANFVQLCDKGRGIMEIDGDCSADAISSEDTQTCSIKYNPQTQNLPVVKCVSLL
jgi:hypothetical protein